MTWPNSIKGEVNGGINDSFGHKIPTVMKRSESQDHNTPEGNARKLTPLRLQYLDIKSRYPDCIVLFRLGDFYETFDEDAGVASSELEIVLTSREMGKGQRVPMAGIPYHALESYLSRLVRRGHKVAICEQVDEPSQVNISEMGPEYFGRTLVGREVVRVVTPGTVMEPSLLEDKVNNYLVAVAFHDVNVGLSHIDITTSEFVTTELSVEALVPELERLGPAEILVGTDGAELLSSIVNDLMSIPITVIDFHDVPTGHGRQILLDHFQVSSLEGYGCERMPLAIISAGMIIQYLSRTQGPSLAQLRTLRTYSPQEYMVLDHQTRRNLELFSAGRFGGQPSLCQVLDFTQTPMGGRLFRRWLGQPLLEPAAIEERLDLVEWFHSNRACRDSVRQMLSKVKDIERLINRIWSGMAHPREVVALHSNMSLVGQIKEELTSNRDVPGALVDNLDLCLDLVSTIGDAIDPDGIGSDRQSIIKDGFSGDLDLLRETSRSGRQVIAEMELEERKRTGIGSLKIGYNRVFGYYLEVTNPHLSKIPDEYIRRQTLANAERFVTPELKAAEDLLLSTEDELERLETTLFRQICQRITEDSDRILSMSMVVADIDVYSSIAENAIRRGFVRPTFTFDRSMDIHGGWHPMVERMLPSGSFVPNDTMLGGSGPSMLLLTGPNMAGKSTFIRQVALIVLLAQTGGFVPAKSAQIGLVDRIFTRVGLQDDLTSGQSTFMVEMLETANILNHATPNSLVILDEIGRGTSTYDGLAIAQAVAEYLHSHPAMGCKTLFATHYHELTEIAEHLPGVANFNVSAAEEGDQIILLHAIVPGPASRSYGVHVARLAGLPPAVISRSAELLERLESGELDSVRRTRKQSNGQQISGKTMADKTDQLPLWLRFDPDILKDIEQLDVSTMTPLEALNLLFELQKRIRDFGNITTS